MVVAVSGFKDFKDKFNRLKDSRDLFLFLLYDSGGDRKAIEKYLVERFEYLDELATASQTFMFLFTPPEMKNRSVRNPGPQVAASFGIRFNQLPGALVFCLADDGESFGHGTYFRLDESLFGQDPNTIDDAFADLFSMIQDVAESETTPKEQISALQRRIRQRQQVQEMGPLIKALAVGTASVITYAGQLLIAVAPAWMWP